MKEREYRLLEAISEDETITQARLAVRLDIAVGSVNWYIKRLISRGYLKATRMDRTRLNYNLTAEGMAALTQRAKQYMIDSLSVYKELRTAALDIVEELQAQDIGAVYLDGDDAVMDIMRLTCLEADIDLQDKPVAWKVIANATGKGYKLRNITPQKES